MRDSEQQFSKWTIGLHWLVGITFIALLVTGVVMKEAGIYALYPIHKSVGILLVLVALARVFWRSCNGWPKPVDNSGPGMRLVAHLVHWMLLIGTLLMPISGMMMSGAGGHGLPIFGWQLLAMNPDPANLGEVIPLNATVAEWGHILHELAGYMLIAVVVLHVAGALKHHWIDKDRTLTRMLGR